jgi:hypothetical protein
VDDPVRFRSYAASAVGYGPVVRRHHAKHHDAKGSPRLCLRWEPGPPTCAVPSLKLLGPAAFDAPLPVAPVYLNSSSGCVHIPSLKPLAQLKQAGPYDDERPAQGAHLVPLNALGAFGTDSMGQLAVGIRPLYSKEPVAPGANAEQDATSCRLPARSGGMLASGFARSLISPLRWYPARLVSLNIPPQLCTILRDPAMLADPRFVAEPKLDGSGPSSASLGVAQSPIHPRPRTLASAQLSPCRPDRRHGPLGASP